MMIWIPTYHYNDIFGYNNCIIYIWHLTPIPGYTTVSCYDQYNKEDRLCGNGWSFASKLQVSKQEFEIIYFISLLSSLFTWILYLAYSPIHIFFKLFTHIYSAAQSELRTRYMLYIQSTKALVNALDIYNPMVKNCLAVSIV